MDPQTSSILSVCCSFDSASNPPKRVPGHPHSTHAQKHTPAHRLVEPVSSWIFRYVQSQLLLNQINNSHSASYYEPGRGTTVLPWRLLTQGTAVTCRETLFKKDFNPGRQRPPPSVSPHEVSATLRKSSVSNQVMWVENGCSLLVQVVCWTGDAPVCGTAMKTSFNPFDRCRVCGSRAVCSSVHVATVIRSARIYSERLCKTAFLINFRATGGVHHPPSCSLLPPPTL